MAGCTAGEEKSNFSCLHLISLFSQQGQELRKPPSKGFHTGSAQKPKDLNSSKPPQMYSEEQMGSRGRRRRSGVLNQHFSTTPLPAQPGAGRRSPGARAAPLSSLTASSLPRHSQQPLAHNAQTRARRCWGTGLQLAQGRSAQHRAAPRLPAPLQDAVAPLPGLPGSSTAGTLWRGLCVTIFTVLSDSLLGRLVVSCSGTTAFGSGRAER